MTIRKCSMAFSSIMCCIALLQPAEATSIPAISTPHSQRDSSEDNDQRIQSQDVELVRALQMRVDHGDARAMNGLGIMYFLGRGVDRNSRIALGLFRRAALQGDVPAMVNLALLYDSHTIRHRDSISAYVWLRAALSFGVPDEARDGVVFRLGMIASRLGPANAAHAEHLASGLIQEISERGVSPTEKSTDSIYN